GIPAYVADLLAKWEQATARLRGELGRQPTPEEVAHHLRLPRGKLGIIHDALRARGRPAPLTDRRMPGDRRAADPAAEISKAEDLQQALRALGALDERQAAVLRMRLGLGGGRPRVLREIGTRLGLSHERVRQIEREALAALRELIPAA